MSSFRDYWEKKSLRWERSRYAGLSILMPSSWTVRRRMNTALQLIRERLPPNARILDLGCGSGILAARLAGHYARFVGVDFASEAIGRAQKRGLNNTEFIESDINDSDLQHDLENDEYDLVILLGLVDWLTEEETEKLFLALRTKDVLFSYTCVARERLFLTQAYELYRWAMDSKSVGSGVAARSYRADFFSSLAKRAGYEVVVELSEALNPGRLVWWRRL